jgi:hypothetical protein
MLYCMTMVDPLKHFYIQYSVDLNAIKKAIRVRLNRAYSLKAISLLEACLVEEPDSRANFEEIMSMYH